MHEMSLCEGMLEILQEQAKTQNYSTVKTVFLEIGKLSNVEPDAMRFAFPVVAKGSLAENATLEIIEVSGQAWCMQCEKNVVIEQRYDGCPFCESHQLQVIDGEQMRIKELEVA
ncbi:MAG: hydrogenase maturation nickel metallochaperone HypA [Methylococcales bacterium]|nr:hydrogenase maturation nickel metallochaperone HypA [Methylococcales bacterium]